MKNLQMIPWVESHIENSKPMRKSLLKSHIFKLTTYPITDAEKAKIELKFISFNYNAYFSLAMVNSGFLTSQIQRKIKEYQQKFLLIPIIIQSQINDKRNSTGQFHMVKFPYINSQISCDRFGKEYLSLGMKKQQYPERKKQTLKNLIKQLTENSQAAFHISCPHSIFENLKLKPYTLIIKSFGWISSQYRK